MIFIFNDKKVLLLHGGEKKRIWPGKFNGIGGHIEKGEDALSAARRELLEESGLKCTSLVLCGTVFIETGEIPGIGLFIFKGQYEGGKPLSSDEGELEWIEIGTLANYPLVEDLNQLLPRVATWELGMPPISGRYFYDENEKLVTNFVI